MLLLLKNVIKPLTQIFPTGTASESGQKEDEWACEKCTLLNKPSDAICDVCSASRPVSLVVSLFTAQNQTPKNDEQSYNFHDKTLVCIILRFHLRVYLMFD